MYSHALYLYIFSPKCKVVLSYSFEFNLISEKSTDINRHVLLVTALLEYIDLYNKSSRGLSKFFPETNFSLATVCYAIHYYSLMLHVNCVSGSCSKLTSLNFIREFLWVPEPPVTFSLCP